MGRNIIHVRQNTHARAVTARTAGLLLSSVLTVLYGACWAVFFLLSGLGWREVRGARDPTANAKVYFTCPGQ